MECEKWKKKKNMPYFQDNDNKIKNDGAVAEALCWVNLSMFLQGKESVWKEIVDIQGPWGTNYSCKSIIHLFTEPVREKLKREDRRKEEGHTNGGNEENVGKEGRVRKKISNTV